MHQNICLSVCMCVTSFMSLLTVKMKPMWILAAVTCFCWLKYRSSLYCRKKKEVHYSKKSKVRPIISNEWPITKAPTSFVVWLPRTAAPSFPCFTYCPLILWDTMAGKCFIDLIISFEWSCTFVLKISKKCFLLVNSCSRQTLLRNELKLAIKVYRLQIKSCKLSDAIQSDTKMLFKH